jgi:hypothetical protein
MRNEKAIKNNSLFLVTSFAVTGIFILLVKDLFFFDEDVFVVNLQSAFMQQDWERSFLAKQLFKVENFFFGKNPAGYHIVSVMLHLGNSIAGLLVFKKLLQNFKAIPVTFKEHTLLYVFFLLFLVSPIHSEPLSYILAQGILVFTLFALLSVLFFLKSFSEGASALFFSLFFFVLSLLCYEISWMIPLIILSIAIASGKMTEVPARRSLMKAICFFVLLAVWFFIKTVFISQTLVADYGDVTLQTLDFMKMGRNSLILFVRNFSPPFQNTSYFIIAAITICIGLATALIWLFKKQRAVFLFSLLLILITGLSFLPTALFGIDSHDSESERYVYFSSVFALMLLAVLITAAIKNANVLRITVALICVLYAAVLYNSINNYRLGGNQSKSYLNEISLYSHGMKTVYTINQPSQLKGALLLRALTRLPEKTGDNYTVLNEYMQYLYGNSKTAFVTVSAREVSNPAVPVKTVQFPLQSSTIYFSEASHLINKPGFEKNEVMIVASRNDSLYIFR